MRRFIVPLTLVLTLGLPAVAPAALRIKPGRLSVKKIGTFKPQRNASLDAATRAFGKPSAVRDDDDNVCNVRWKDIGLKIVFVNLGGGSACGEGSAQTFRAEGERFATSQGLRVRGSARAVLNAHPNAERHRSSFWLKTAVSPFGDGDTEYPVLRAEFGAGRVTAFNGFIGAAGE